MCKKLQSVTIRPKYKANSNKLKVTIYLSINIRVYKLSILNVNLTYVKGGAAWVLSDCKQKGQKYAKNCFIIWYNIVKITDCK